MARFQDTIVSRTLNQVALVLKKFWNFFSASPPKQLCKLCGDNIADKRNSHIVPKFLTKSIFSINPKKTLIFDETGKSKQSQDTPKEDNILCSSCERKIGIVESIFARVIPQLYSFEKFPQKFTHHVKGVSETVSCNDVSPGLFSLFIYSILWRLSISSVKSFSKFKLSPDTEEILREFLNNNLSGTHKELISNFDIIDRALPQYHLCFFKPKIRTYPPGGILSAYSYDERMHLIMLVDFGLFFILDDDRIHPALAQYSNKGREKMIMGLGNNSDWIALNSMLFNQYKTSAESKSKT